MAVTGITVRMDAELKEQADELFGKLGMSLTTACNIFVRQCLREQRIPFDITAVPSRPRERGLAKIPAVVMIDEAGPEDGEE